MPQFTVTKCEGCGKEEQHETPKGWLHIVLDTYGGTKEVYNHYFCSWHCWVQYGVAKVEETGEQKPK